MARKVISRYAGLIISSPKARSRLLFIFLLLLVSIQACEKDDICVDGDTPLLIIRFYDIADTAELKSATSLRVIGLGQSGTVNTFNDRSTTDSIGLPLKIDQSETSFVFILNSADTDGEETGNADTLRISYDPKEVFVSRACGYVINFENLAITPLADTDPWIGDLTIVKPNVENQSGAHVKIFY